MTDSIVQFGLETLSALLSREASLIRGVRNEVEEIKLELETMQALLKDADKRKESNEGVRTWVRQVRDSTYDVEDIMDEFMYRMDRPRRTVSFNLGFLLDIVCLPMNICDKHCFAIRLQETKVKVHNLFDTGVAFGLNQIGEGTSSHDVSKMWQRDVETSLSLEEDDIVGMKKEFDLIVRWLVEEEQRRTVISVTGMGGAGKTVLVTKAYKNELVKKHFDYSACVSISQTLRIDEVLRSIIKQFLEATKDVVPNDLATRDASDLRQMIKRHLESKKCLIVLDDIWSMNDWKELSVIFADYRCRSRLVVTTRDSDVALAAGEGSRVCQLQPLHPEEAWQLFCKKAFRNKPCPSELKPLALDIVEKCQGLPLAIVAVGSLLSLREANVLEWNRVYNNLSWHLNNNERLEPIKRISLLSFYYLPYRLKQCFLYCCMFPEDYLIRGSNLIRLWVAEGFVEDAGKIPMEEMAEDYLKELIHRNTLQVVEMNLSGRVRACRMHDIVRELALSLCDEENLCIRYDGQQTRQGGKVRRMSIYNSGETIQHSMSMSRLRSLLVFEGSTSFSCSLNAIASSFMLLRVLDLGGVPIESLPDELMSLFNLRYLNLKNTKVSELPKSIGGLRNLQTLNVRQTRIKTLPSGIVKLQKLRHLIGYRYNMADLGTFWFVSSIQIPIGICNITSLQTLNIIEAKEGEIVRQIGNLTQLRKLRISKVRAINGAELCTSIAKMKYLVNLCVIAINEEEALQLEELSPDHLPLFQKLYLVGRLEKVPQWFRYLAHLAVLKLYWSKLREEDPLSLLQALPNLVRLQLWTAYEGQQLCFHDGWFPKLRKLQLMYLSQLNRVVIEKGTLPSIQELTVFRCGELKTLPEGFEYLTKLRDLRLGDMPTEFTERLRLKDGNEDRSKVGHIPFIYGGHRTEEGWHWHRLN